MVWIGAWYRFRPGNRRSRPVLRGLPHRYGGGCPVSGTGHAGGPAGPDRGSERRTAPAPRAFRRFRPVLPAWFSGHSDERGSSAALWTRRISSWRSRACREHCHCPRSPAICRSVRPVAADTSGTRPDWKPTAGLLPATMGARRLPYHTWRPSRRECHLVCRRALFAVDDPRSRHGARKPGARSRHSGRSRFVIARRVPRSRAGGDGGISPYGGGNWPAV
jgi:hypothetical protein